jgi:L-lactate dehydrogenase (cytochrome)
MAMICVEDYRKVARRALPRFLFDYIDGGSYGENTLRANVRDLQDISLRQRVLRDVSELDLSVELFGQRFALPFGLGPIGLAGMYARRGECQAEGAAGSANIPFILSTMSVCPLEEVAQAAGRPFWFQLYMLRDRGFVSDMLARAREAQCSALVFTVDLPVPGTRYRDYRSGLSGSTGAMRAARRFAQALACPAWTWRVGINGRPHTLGNVAPALEGKTGLEDVLAWASHNFDASATWDNLAFVRDQWSGPLILKGILDPCDARRAVEVGADGLIVSNHGGRQLDGAISVARALPAIVDAVGNDLIVMADGGIRSGLDVARLLALGARTVLLGRAWAYALAAGGRTAVERMIGGIEAELRVAMALTGAQRIDDLDASTLTVAPDRTGATFRNSRFHI